MILEKYTQNWITKFEDIKAELETTLGIETFKIEHIGSTSVPFLDAKPIIDIDIIYSDSSDFEFIKSNLERIGYEHKGNQGIIDREVFKRKGSIFNSVLDTIKHHLYVCHIDSKALERHLLTRNFLRKNEWARIKYQKIKYELAEKANQDRKKYAYLKEISVNNFIDSIINEEKGLKNL